MNRANRPRLSRISGSSYASKLLGRAGDGSTLSLDFTTGVLDPRLTFTRSTNATFINSSGLVEWANANMYWNTAFEGLSGTNPSLTSSGWGYVFSSGNAVFNGDNTVTITTTAAQRSVLFRSTGFSGNGLRVIASVDVTIHSGSLQASQVMVTGTPTNAQHYVNGVIWNNTHPNWNGGILPVGTQFNISYATDTQTSGTTSMWIGVGCSSAIAGSATFVNPRWTMWKGSATVPYYPNTSATNNSTANYFKSNDYQAPRFDYDPTTLAPRGLLIEGSASNAALNSDVMRGTGWVATNLVTPSNAAGITDPANGTNSTNYIANGTTGYHFSGVVSTTTGASTTAITWSCWVKANGYTKVLMAEGNSGRGAVSFDIDPNNATPPAPTVVGGAGSPAGTITRYPNNWYRIAMRVGVASSTAYQWNVVGYPTGATLGNFGAQYTGDSTNGIYVWGAMLEDGSGASSYIPTGASQGTRNADECSMTGTNFSSWFNATEGAFLAHARRMRTTDVGRIASANDNTANESIDIGASTTGQFIVTDGGSALATITPGTVTANTAFKIAGAFKLNDVQAALGGTLGTPDTGVTMPTVNQLMIGRQAGGSPVYLNGTVSLLKFWPTRLPDSQLQSLTT